jgi:hypothetical protein
MRSSASKRVDAQAPLGRLAKHVQAIADLRFLQVAQVGVQARQPDRRVGVAVQLASSCSSRSMWFAHQLQDVALQLRARRGSSSCAS